MRECIDTLVPDRSFIKNEMISELRTIMSQSIPETDLMKMRRKIRTLEEKSKRAIDLTLDGVISENDLTNQMRWYQEEIQRLNDKIQEAEKIIEQRKKIENNMEPYIQVLDEITEKEPDVEMVFHEILDEIHVHPGNILDIWLKDISFGIRFQVKTMGRNEDYKTVISEKAFIQGDTYV